ncbi:MAG: hypothetical protein MJY47_06805 [Fibrobacter sp.]|nr:hypothetical protein [Fibrobacter sp.]
MRKEFISCIAIALLIGCGNDDDSSTAPDENQPKTDFVVDILDDLPACVKSREGKTALLQEVDSTYICKDGQWIELKEEDDDNEPSDIDSVETEDDLLACTKKREGEQRYIAQTKSIVLCHDGTWEELNEKSSDSKKNDDEDSSSSSEKDADDSKDKSSNSKTSSSSTISSSSIQESSSSVAVEETGPIQGVCTAVPSAIVKNDSTTWHFIRIDGGTVSTYDWIFEGASPATSTKETPKVTYEKGGTFSASVTINKGTSSENTVNCTKPVKVTGATISDCTCKPNVTKADLAEEGSATVTWTVSGCTNSDESTGFSYTWDDDPENTEMTLTQTFTERIQSYAPTVTVSNEDQDSLKLTCNPVKVDDSNDPLCEEISVSLGTSSYKDILTTLSGGCYTIDLGKNCAIAYIYSASGTGTYTINGIESTSCTSKYSNILSTSASTLSIEVSEGCSIKEIYVSSCTNIN